MDQPHTQSFLIESSGLAEQAKPEGGRRALRLQRKELSKRLQDENELLKKEDQ